MFVSASDGAGRSSYHRLASLALGSTSVLDVGCGTGTLLSLVRDTAPSARLAGIDLSESELRVATARLPTARLCVARAQALPLASGSVDLVLCHLALMLMDRPEEVLLEGRRVLRSGGWFGAITTRRAAPPMAKVILAALRPAIERSNASMHPPPLGDARTVESDTLASLVSAEFDQVSVEQFAVVRYVPREHLWSFLSDSLYGLDAIPDAEAEAVLDTLALPDPLPWTIPMVQVEGRA